MGLDCYLNYGKRCYCTYNIVRIFVLYIFIYLIIVQFKCEDWKRGGTFNGAYKSVRRTDFYFNKPKPFTSLWYLQKWNGARLRYELELCIWNGNVVSAHGPFACGYYSYMSNFRVKLQSAVENCEKDIADTIYTDAKVILASEGLSAFVALHQRIWARNQTFNWQLKVLEIYVTDTNTA